MTDCFKQFLWVVVPILAAVWRPASAGDWPQVQHDPAHTGYTTDQPDPPYSLRWKRDLEEPIATAQQPIVAEGRLFIGTNYGNLYALDPRTGQTRWRYSTRGPILGSPAFAGGTVYVNSMDHFLHALKAEDGEFLWTFETGEGIWAAPVVADGEVFIAARDGYVYAVNPADGKEIWRREIGSPVLTTPAYAVGKLYVGAGDMHVYALDGRTGDPVWKSPKIPGAAMREYWLTASQDVVIVTTQLAFACHHTQEMIQRAVMNPFNQRHKDDPVLVEDPIFPELVKWYETHPHHKTVHVLDAQTGKEKFIAPVIGVNGGSCTSPPPAVGPDGWAYTPYANVWLRASGWAFFGRFNLGDGRMEPLIRNRFAPKLAYPNEWHWQPKAGSQFTNRSVWDGGFSVSDQSWGVSIGGRRAFLVRDPGWVTSVPSYNTVHRETLRDEYLIPGASQLRRLLEGGTFGGPFHSTAAPMAISGNDLFHKSARSVLYAFEGTGR